MLSSLKVVAIIWESVSEDYNLPYYAGIGSRNAPEKYLRLASKIASFLEGKGYILRSGAAPGMDSAFEDGLEDHHNSEIFTPWSGFGSMNYKYNSVCDWALSIARKYHPNWNVLKPSVTLLMGRNTYQVLGPTENSEKSEFIICWTNPKRGGTLQAIRIAEDYSIPVYNMWYSSDTEKFLSMLKEMK